MDWKEFYRGKRVLVTGHTGFKGSWMCELLLLLGAEVTGYALDPPTNPSIFALNGLTSRMNSVIGDVRDYEKLSRIFAKVRPEIVFHLAAQPIVRTSYELPRETYEINVMGTVNVMECVRHCDSVISVVNVTTDKVYKNKERAEGYREDEELNGYDPYSNSKSCSELVTDSYRNAFFLTRGLPVSTCRAGNVIGGGDFAKDRIIPDCVRAAERGETVYLRNPGSIRPYQHVLEPVSVYLELAARQTEDSSLAGAYNIGPEESDTLTTKELTERFLTELEAAFGKKTAFDCRPDGGPHEAGILKLNCEKVRRMLRPAPAWQIDKGVQMTARWYAAYETGNNMDAVTKEQVDAFLCDLKHLEEEE